MHTIFPLAYVQYLILSLVLVDSLSSVLHTQRKEKILLLFISVLFFFSGKTSLHANSPSFRYDSLPFLLFVPLLIYNIFHIFIYIIILSIAYLSFNLPPSYPFALVLFFSASLFLSRYSILGFPNKYRRYRPNHILPQILLCSTIAIKFIYIYINKISGRMSIIIDDQSFDDPLRTQGGEKYETWY